VHFYTFLNLTLPVPLTTSRETFTTATAVRTNMICPTADYDFIYLLHYTGRLQQQRTTRHRGNTIRTTNVNRPPCDTPPCEYDMNYELQHATVRIRYELRTSTRHRANTIWTTNVNTPPGEYDMNYERQHATVRTRYELRTSTRHRANTI
jgi:hypothetical protein